MPAAPLRPNATRHAGRRRGLPVYALSIALVLSLAPWYWSLTTSSVVIEPGLETVLVTILFGIELVGGYLIALTAFKCLGYLQLSRPTSDEPRAAPRDASSPPFAVVYLCAGDLDHQALESLCRLEDASYEVFVHDDSSEPHENSAVEHAVADLRARTGKRITLLRRSEHTGGKPGAVNHVLEHIGERFPFFLLCDADSIALDPRAAQKVLVRFEDPRVAVVQCRNVGVAEELDGPVNRLLHKAIGVFDLFAVHQARHGFMPCVGHNAFLRTRAFREVGGMSRGCFADDIDLSVRLATAGWRIQYAGEVAFGERHPRDYDAFRRRSYKWALGCGQILRRHLFPVLRSPKLSFAEKTGLLDFVGFYAAQVLMALYLLIAYVVVPLAGVGTTRPSHSPLGGAIILAAILSPILTYHLAKRQLRTAWPFAWVCSLVYGSTALITARGLVQGLVGRERTWIPTNAASRQRSAPWLFVEASFGAALVVVPALRCPELLLDPAPHAFAAVFLLAPLLTLTYVQEHALARLRLVVPARSSICLVLLLGIGMAWGPPAPAEASDGTRVALSDARFLVDGEPILVRGIHYGPWRPGTGPGKHYPWPDGQDLDDDLEEIRRTGANTILVHEAPRRVIQRAARAHLLVVETYYIDWQSLDDTAAFEQRKAEIVGDDREISGERNLLAILLGNEVQEWIVDQWGSDLVEARLEKLYRAVKAVAPRVPTSHSNWPVTKQLDLSFMDFAAFNLYPSWPREVAVRGYGTYISEVLRPIAGERPLLISEFGQNSLEVSQQRQAKILADCWKEISARTSGGVVFEFADEWWKNYDNPIDDTDWWQREHAPNDELTHDLDPEEHYGIFTTDRRPKQAAHAVRAFFRSGREASSAHLWLLLPFGAIVAYTAYLLLFQGRTLSGSSVRDEDTSPPLAGRVPMSGREHLHHR